MKTEQILADRAFLVERFPLCFAAKGQPKRPLQVGIHADMLRLGVLPARRLKAFLGDYCRGPNYHEAVARGGPRYRLDGSIAGQVDELSRRQAVSVLGEIRAASRTRAELKMLRAAMAGIAAALEPWDIHRIQSIVREAQAWRYDPASARGPSAPGSKEPESLSGGERAEDRPPAPVAAEDYL